MSKILMYQSSKSQRKDGRYAYKYTDTFEKPQFVYAWKLVPTDKPCGVHSVDTKSEIVKILHFKQFYKHYVFVEDGEGGRKKVLKNYIDVNVCIDMVCGDTKYELGSEE